MLYQSMMKFSSDNLRLTNNLTLMKMNKSIIDLGLASLIFISLISCRSLNRNVSLSQLQDRSSLDMKSVFTNPDISNCETGRNIDGINQSLKNNLWGKNKVKKGVPELCVYKKGNYFGWKWSIPNNASGVIGYPAMHIGQNPFSNIKNIKSGFPVKLASISEFKVDYDFETYVKHHKYNLAFDLWLTNTQFSTKKDIKTEIMIWEDYFDFTSYGKKKGTLITPFGIYTLHTGYLNNPKYGQDWQYIAFVRKSTRNKGMVDINHLLNYLIEENLISGEDFLTSLELGNEIGNSSGMTLVKKFEWELKVK